MKRKFLIFICMILFFVSIAGVSAAEDANQTVDDDALSVSDNIDELSAKDDGTFTALQEKINNAAAGSTITLENDYIRNQDEINKIEINKRLTINGNGHSINANADYYSQSRILYITSPVTLNDISFSNAYVTGHYSEPGHYNGADIYSSANLVVNNCRFSDSYIKEGYGSAIYCEADVELNDCVFTGLTGYANGGYGRPTSVEAENVKVSNSRFTDNVLPLYVNNHLTVVNSIFTNNDGAISGESVSVKGSTFRNNSYSFNRAGGGAISARSDSEIDGCTFIGNSAYYGGALGLGGNNTSVSNCIFEENSATFGGAIHIFKNGEVTVTNSNFTKNTASSGGAAYLEGINTVFHSLNFIENSAGYGGAICTNDCINTIINYCNFIKNHANAYGGAIGSWDVLYNYVANSYFEDNTASGGEMIAFDESLGLIYKEVNLVSKISDIRYEQDVSKMYAEGITLKNNTLTVHGYYDGYFLSGNVVLEIAGKTFSEALNDVGTAVFDLNGLSGGTHEATIYCSGESGASTSQITLPIPVESSTRLDVPDVTKNYGGPERLEITLTEAGSPVANADVNININGIDYSRKTDNNGKASLGLKLNAGNYNATVTYKEMSAMAKVTINKLATKTTLSASKNSHNSFTLEAVIDPSTAGGNVVFTVNGKDYAADKVSGGKATRTISNLAVGKYEAKASYKGDVNHKASASKSVKFTVEDVKVDVTAPDLTKYYHGPERFVVTVEEDNKPVVGKDVSIILNGVPYTRTTDSNGQASMAINLNSGTYRVVSEYEGIKVKSTINVESTISGEDVTKIFRNDTQYYATFVDTSGKVMKNTDVKFNINGVFYTRTTNDKGVARMNINLNPEEYVITAENPISGEKYTNLITVLPSIVEVHNLTKYYKNDSKLTFKLLDDKGKPVGEGVAAKININGVFYERKSNASGYVNMNINLNPGTYIATLEYNGLMASSTVKVLPILEAKDINMKYRDGTKFEAKLLDGKGRPFAGQNLTFNINGVFYNRPTDENGIARLAINLMAGEYIITSMYENGAALSNKVTIRG